MKDSTSTTRSPFLLEANIASQEYIVRKGCVCCIWTQRLYLSPLWVARTHRKLYARVLWGTAAPWSRGTGTSRELSTGPAGQGLTSQGLCHHWSQEWAAGGHWGSPSLRHWAPSWGPVPQAKARPGCGQGWSPALLQHCWGRGWQPWGADAGSWAAGRVGELQDAGTDTEACWCPLGPDTLKLCTLMMPMEV